jgi:hypothetical protein
MAPFPGLVGSTARVRSVIAGSERTVNLYVEQEPGTPKAPATLYATPCVRPFAVMGDGPVRALFSQDGRCFAVSGSSFYEIFASRTVTLRGTATADGSPATISSNGSNGNQLFVTSGGVGYIYNLLTNTIAAVTTNAEPVQMGAFSDGYFLALQRTSNRFTYSALYDGTTWDALDFYQVSTVADQVVTMIESHRDIWLLGSQTSSVWNNTGDADNPWQPIPGVKIEMGSAAAFSAVNLDNTLYWLGGNQQGNRVVYRANGYTPERISNHAVEWALNQYPQVSNAVAWAYQDEGHAFYVLFLPSKPPRNSPVDWTSWVYDVATGQWHERAVWDNVLGQWEPHYGRCHTYAFGRHLIGDRSSGAIYELSLNLTVDTVVTGVN